MAYSKLFRVVGMNDVGNGQWSVNFREVVDTPAPGAPAPQQANFSLTMGLQEAIAMVGAPQRMTLGPEADA